MTTRESIDDANNAIAQKIINAQPLVPLRLHGHDEAITIDRVRQVIANVPDEVPLEVAVRDDQHFNRLIGNLPVLGVSVNRGPNSVVILLDVAGIT